VECVPSMDSPNCPPSSHSWASQPAGDDDRHLDDSGMQKTASEDERVGEDGGGSVALGAAIVLGSSPKSAQVQSLFILWSLCPSLSLSLPPTISLSLSFPPSLSLHLSLPPSFFLLSSLSCSVCLG